MTLQQRQQLMALGFPLPFPPGNWEQVHALHEGGDCGRGDKAGDGNFVASVTPVECRSEKADETSGGCRALLRQRGPSGTANFGRPQVSTGRGASEELECKCYEVDPSLCVCRVSSKPQQFFIGDFADSSDPEDLKSGPGSGGRPERCDGIRALRHLGSRGDSKDLRGQGEGVLVPGEIAKISEGKAKAGLFSILVPGEIAKISQGKVKVGPFGT